MIEIDVSSGFELGSFHYSIESDPEAQSELQAKASFGDCNNPLRRIRIDPSYSAQETHHTICHELVEAINSIFCLGKVKHDDLESSANGLAQALKSLGIAFCVQGDSSLRKTEEVIKIVKGNAK